MRNKIFIGGLIILSLLIPKLVGAGVVINAVKYGETGNANNEFIELYNNSSGVFDISNWRIYKYTKLSTSTSDRILVSDIPSFSFSAFGYLLLGHASSSFDLDIKYSSSSLASNNTVFLCQEDDTVVDMVGYGDATAFEGIGATPDPGTKSIVRVNFVDTDNNVADFVIKDPSPRNSLYVEPIETPTTTPPDETPTTTPTSTIQDTNNIIQLRINEFVPNPLSGEEWVEIFNLTTSSVIIDGLKLFDAVGEMVTPTGTIEAGGFFVIELSSSKLNNTGGDSVILKDASSTVIDSVSYNEIGKGNAMARSVDGAGSFKETTTVTKGVVNIITAPVVVPLSSGGGATNNNAQEIRETIEIKNRNFVIGEVVINELVSDPNDGEEEFVELYNKTLDTIDLANWWLEDGSKSKTVLTGNILSKGFFVIEKPKGSLNNSGDSATLFSPDGKEIDKMIYGNLQNNAPIASDPNSLIRKTDGEDTGNDKNDFVVTNLITKGASNKLSVASSTEKIETIVETEIQKDFGVYINELLPNPKGLDTSEEFIEIFNSSTSTVNLTNWILVDASNKKYKIVKGEILPKGYLFLKRLITKITLDNSGTESVRLLNPEGVLADMVEYEDSAPESESLIRLENGEWDWTITSTPNEKNVLTKSKIEKKVVSKSSVASTKKVIKGAVNTSLENIYNAEVGASVRVIGIVSVLPSVFGTQYFYISSSTCGVQIYMNSKKFPSLKVGDIVQVSGEISEPNGEKRVKVKNTGDIKIIGFTNFVAPVELNTVDLGESVGALAKVKGEITDIKTTYMYVNDEEGEIKIMFKQGANIAKGELHLGDIVEVSGIINRSTSGIQLLPRSSVDIVKVGVAEKVEDVGATSEVAETYLTATAGGLTSILIGLLAKARGKFVFGLLKKVGGLAMAVVKWKKV